MKRYVKILLALLLCLSLVAATFITDKPASAQEETGSISGRVTDNQTGLLVSGALILVWDYDSLLSGDVWWAYTDSNGYYRTSGLSSGDYGVLVQFTGYASEWYQDTLFTSHAAPVLVTAPDDTPNINFSLEPGGTISGRVVDTETGQAVSGARIWVFDYNSLMRGKEWLFCDWATTDSNGYYRTHGLPAGEYGLRVHATNYATEWYQDTYYSLDATSVEVTAPDDAPNIDFSLELGGTISGNVIDTETGQPVSGANIDIFDYASLAPGKQGMYYTTATTDDNGHYVTVGLSAGDYSLRVCATNYATEWYQDTYYVSYTSDDGYAKLKAIAVSVNATADTPDIDFSLEPGGTISGHVYQSDNTTPIEGALISAWKYDTLYDSWLLYGYIRTSADGSYTTLGLSPGEYALGVAAVGYASEWYEDSNSREAIAVSVNATADTPDIDFSLEPGGTISGHVYESDGTTPATEAEIVIYEYDSLSGNWVYCGWGWGDLDSDGSYTTVGLLAGQYALWVLAEGYAGEWYDNIYYPDAATPVSVVAGQDTGNIDFWLGRLYETPIGDNVTVSDDYSGVTLEFDNVSEDGDTSINVSEQNPGGDIAEFEFIGEYYDINTDASYSGNITVTIDYDEADIPEEQSEEDLRLYHWSGSAWEDVTVLPVDTVNNQITGVVTSLSWLTIGIPPEVTWLPPLSTEMVYLAQDGSTIPIKFQLTDVSGNLISKASIIVTVTRDSDGATVLSGPATYEPDISGYRINAQTKEWMIGEYTIHLSVNQDATYGLSIMQMGQAKGRRK